MTVVVDASVVAEILLGTERGAKAAPLIRDLPTVAKILEQMRTNARNVRYEDLAKVCEHTLAHQGLEFDHGKAKPYQVRQVIVAIDKKEAQ